MGGGLSLKVAANLAPKRYHRHVKKNREVPVVISIADINPGLITCGREKTWPRSSFTDPGDIVISLTPDV